MDAKWRVFFREAREEDWNSISELPFTKPTLFGNKQYHSRFHQWQSPTANNVKLLGGTVFKNFVAKTGNLIENASSAGSLGRDYSPDGKSPHTELAGRHLPQLMRNFQLLSGTNDDRSVIRTPQAPTCATDHKGRHSGEVKTFLKNAIQPGYVPDRPEKK